jgi:nucleoside-diphosphate-sugar epimerase
MKLVVTGASGYVAGRMLDALRERYELTLLDVKTTNREGQEVDGIVVTDLLNEDRDTYRSHFSGADAVLHCGFTRSNTPDGRFFAEHDNVKMAYNVYQTCVEEGVGRAVVISSNHAADYYEKLIWSDRMEYVTPEMVPLSDNFYGWAKASYELLGFAYATGNVSNGKKLEMVQLRVGGPRETDIDRATPDDLKKMHRALGAYLSVRDQAQLVIKSLETPNIDDENGVPFQIFYGISGNSHNFWSLANAKRVIGYAPEDNSAIKFADKIATILEQAQSTNYGG